MRFEIAITLTAVLAIAGLGLTACSNIEDDENEYLVGERPETYSSGYMWGGSSTEVAMVDQAGDTIQHFRIEPFAHVRSLPLPLKQEQVGLIASSGGSYYVTIGGGASDYAITKANGETRKNPEQIVGTIKSVAYDAAEHILVITDDFETMAFFLFSPDGTILGSCRAGSAFSDKGTVMSGAMMPGGTLALAVGTKTLALVDVRATVENRCQAVTHTEIEVPDATDMAWVAAVPDRPGNLLIRDGNRLLHFETKAPGRIAQSFDLTGKTVVSYSRYFVPHLILQGDVIGTEHLYQVVHLGDGGFASASLRAKDRKLRQSYLDEDGGTLTLDFDPERDYTFDPDNTHYVHYRKRQIFRFRLADNLVMDRTDIGDLVHTAVTPSHLVNLFESVMGYAVRRAYGENPEQIKAEGYNLELLKKRYKDRKSS